jgi:adenylate cyclase class 2
MNIEHELKFLVPQPETVLEQLINLGGRLSVPRSLLRRCVFFIPGSPYDDFIRLRDEGERITLTYKRVTTEGVYEEEECVQSFDVTRNLLQHVRLTFSSYQENFRTTYILGDAVVTLDEWPGVPPFLEIEAPDPSTLLQTIERLELDPTQGIVGPASAIYQSFGINLDNFPEVTFQCIPTVTKS